MSRTCVGAWHIRPTPARFEGKPHVTKTWNGPISPEIYGKGLKDLCNRTQDNLSRLSLQMQNTDPCFEYGMKHWHPDSRPQSVCGEHIERPKTPGRWESVEVMFTDNKFLDSLGSQVDEEERETYVDPPARKSFCYLCSTLEEHERHLQQHRPRRRPTSARPRITYIAPKPRQKPKSDKEEEILAKDRLYKIEVYTTDRPNAGTSANVYISIKGSLDVLPRTQLVKKRGSAQMCFMRASKETFHIKGPFLGNLQILSVEQDGSEKKHAWHLHRIEVTDIKALKTWIFQCQEWLSTFKKPHYTNHFDLTATEKETQPSIYSIEVHTGKQKMAGTDSNIFITLIGQHGSSKKIHLLDNSSDKKLFEKGSIDKFKIMVPNVGELKRIRIEHDGKGFAAGWFLSKVVILDSQRPKDCYYFTYGGWIAKDEGDGRLWREIVAKKKLPSEIKDANGRHEKITGTDTRYEITCKTGDVRFAGTDANVFIQIAGLKGITPKLKLDDARNNFERNMVDNFDIRSVNVGNMDHIVIGHDNFGPGAGWYLEKVTIKRHIPKDEARERMKKMQKNKKKQEKKKKRDEDDDESDDDDDNENKKSRSRRDREKKRQTKKDLFSVSSEEESDADIDDDRITRRPESRGQTRPGSALSRSSDGRRPSSAYSRSSDSRRPTSANQRNKGGSRHGSTYGRNGEDDEEELEPERGRGHSRDRFDKYSDDRRRGSTSTERIRRDSNTNSRLSNRRVSTSASSLRNRDKKNQHDDDDDDDNNVDEIRVPLYEECVFECNNWLAADEGDGLFVRELTVSSKNTYYKEPKM
ncbi:hypothetical protein ACF0H5_001276 [Mactra antiquata]